MELGINSWSRRKIADNKRRMGRTFKYKGTNL